MYNQCFDRVLWLLDNMENGVDIYLDMYIKLYFFIKLEYKYCYRCYNVQSQKEYLVYYDLD